MPKALEERKLESEINAKSRELDLKEREVKIQEKTARRAMLNPAALGLFAAAVGLLGNATVAFYNSRASMELERFKSQSSLVLEAIKTGNAESACKNLEFLADLKRIDSPDETKAQCQKIHPFLPPANAASKPFGTCRLRGADGTSCTMTDNDSCRSLGGVWDNGSSCN